MLLSLLLPALILLFRPFGMDNVQSLLLASLVLVIFWWVANCMPKWISSLILLLIFSIFGRTELTAVFQFPLSDNFIVILFAFLFSQGIANSGLTRRLLQPLFYRWIHTPVQFLLFVMVCNTALIFVIPQPFARIILFAFIADEFLRDVCRDEKCRGILMFAVFVFSMSSNMLFRRGDIILNYAVLTFGEITMTESAWAAAMTLPTILLMFAELGLFLLLYRRDLLHISFSEAPVRDPSGTLSGRDWGILALVAITMLLMATESLHGIASKWLILGSTLIMFLIRLLKFDDIKAINFNLLVWLTASFSIGNVMRGSGTAELVFSRLSALFPNELNFTFLLVVVLISMGLHMLLGGGVTTTSVVLPSIISIAVGAVADAPVKMLVLIVYIVVYGHFLLPIHNAVLVIGSGDNRFPNSVVMQYGGCLTIMIPLFVLFVYPWWWQIVNIF